MARDPSSAAEDLAWRRVGAAWLILLWERVWQAAWPLLTVAGIFLAVALMDLLPLLPRLAHGGVLALFAAALPAALWFGFRRFRLPGRDAAERRLETASGLAHRPFAAVRDRLAGGDDPAQRRLWALHQQRMQASLARLRLGWPRPGIARLDPHALRVLAVLLLVIGISAGREDPLQRLGRALVPPVLAEPVLVAELDVWLNPPAYTGRPPVRLDARQAGGTVSVPAGSELLARLFGRGGAPTLRIGEAATPFDAVDDLNHQIEAKLETVGQTVLAIEQAGGTVASWPLDVVADRPPTADLAEAPSFGSRGVLRIDYLAGDDYGLTGLAASFRLVGAENGEAHTVALPLGGVRPVEVAETTYQDLTAHPWAGLEVELQVVATDEIGQTGVSGAFRLTLPERAFSHPTARAVIEQRRNLSRAPERRRITALALNAIADAPDEYGGDVTAFLGMTTAAIRLRNPDEPVAAVQELLWDVALRIEDGQMSLAERALRDAQQALMDALDRGAEDSEVERLMDELQQALQDYMQAMAERAQELAERGELPTAPEGAQPVRPQDLQEMVDRARELSRLGSRDAAREMLRQLQEMLENLQNGTMMAMPNGQQQQGQGSLGEMGEMMQRQQELLDRTFRNTPPGWQQQPGQRGQQGQQGEQGEGLEGMAGDQEALRRRLGEMMGRMADRLGEVPGGMGEAEQAMRDARDALGRGDGQGAADAQGRALEQMARGMREMAEEMARQMGEGQGEGQSQLGSRGRDPLGRPLPSGGLDTNRVEIPEASEIQRAREILDELRRRAGERERPEVEREYIDRLLERF